MSSNMRNRIKRAALALAAALMLTACSGGNPAVSGAGSSASSAESAESAPVESAGQTTGEASGTADAGADITVEVPQGETAAATTEDEEMSEEVKYIALTFDDGPNATTTSNGRPRIT